MATPAHQSNGNATSEIPTVAMARRSLAWDAEIPGRDVINEPDTIVRDEEWVTVCAHRCGPHREHDGAAMAPPDCGRRFVVCREVAVMTISLEKSMRLDRVEKAGGGSVVENLRRVNCLETEFNWNRVSLVGADALSIIGESEALLVVLRHHLCEFVTRSVLAGT